MDRYGYYQIGDYKTYSFYELMDRYKEDPQPYKWVYNDEFFSQYDWTQEPTESLDELYKQRAQELREQYDYIVLHYSGGYDSANMLRAFVDNGIYPDELLIYYSSYDTVGYQYHELKNYTWKKIEKIEKEYPQIKIRKIDYSNIIFNWPTIIKDTNEYLGLDWDPKYYFGSKMSVNRIVLDVMYEYINDWKRILKDKKSLCNLQGVDQPKVRYLSKQNLFVHNFNDQDSQGHITTVRQMTNKNNRDCAEFFYWAPTDVCAKIQIKQCHLLKKYYNGLCNGDWLKFRFWSSNKYKGSKSEVLKKQDDVDVYTNINFSYSYEPSKKIIYPNIFTKDEKFYNDRNISTLWGNRDTWYYNNDLPNSQKHWETIYLPILEDKNKHWRDFFNNKDNLDLGYKKILSKNYII